MKTVEAAYRMNVNALYHVYYKERPQHAELVFKHQQAFSDIKDSDFSL